MPLLTHRYLFRSLVWMHLALLATALCLFCAFWQQNERDQNLTVAVGNGDSAQVRRLLDQGANPNADMARGYSWKDYLRRLVPGNLTHYREPVLNDAIRRNDVASARLLIDRGADVNAPDSFRNAPLVYAADNAHVGLVEELIRRGARANIPAPQGVCSVGMTREEIRQARQRTLIEKVRQSIESASKRQQRFEEYRMFQSERQVRLPERLVRVYETAARQIPAKTHILEILQQAAAKEQHPAIGTKHD